MIIGVDILKTITIINYLGNIRFFIVIIIIFQDSQDRYNKNE